MKRFYRNFFFTNLYPSVEKCIKFNTLLYTLFGYTARFVLHIFANDSTSQKSFVP